MTTALTAYLTSTADSLLTTADQLTNSPPSSEAAASSKVGKLTGWGELLSQGTTGAWPAGGSEPAPSGNGWLWDVTTLEGQQIVSGTWTPKIKLIASKAGVTAVIHVRAYDRSSAGVYTLIGDWATGSTAISTTATVYSPTAASEAVVNFGTGNKLYIDVVLDITANTTGSTTSTVSVYRNGGANEEVVTPGYQVQPITGTAAVSIATASAAVAAEKFSGTGAVAVAIAISGAGNESVSFTGTGTVSISIADAGVGAEAFSGTAAVAIPTANAATGGETFSGTAAVAVPTANAAAGGETFSGTGTAVIATVSSGTATETFSGSGAIAITSASAGVGSVAALAITGSGSVAIGTASAGTGDPGQVLIYSPGGGGVFIPFKRIPRPPKAPATRPLLAVVGHGHVAVSPFLAGTGVVAESEDWLFGLLDDDILELVA